MVILSLFYRDSIKAGKGMRMRLLSVVIMAFVCLASISASGIYLSPVDLKAGPDGNTLFVADETGGQVLRFDCGRRRVQDAWTLDAGAVHGLAVAADGKSVYAACGGYHGQVVELAAATGQILRRIPVGHTPMSPLLSPDGRTLYVAHRFNHEVVSIDLAKGRIARRWPVAREPVALALTPDGTRLFALNLIPAGPSSLEFQVSPVREAATSLEAAIQDNQQQAAEDPEQAAAYQAALATLRRRLAQVSVELKQQEARANGLMVSCEVTVIETAPGCFGTAIRHLRLPNGSINAHGLCISPDGGWVYATHQVGRYQAPTSQVTRGWMNTNALTIINAKTLAVETVLLDDLSKGAANPWGVACTPDGRRLLVTHSGLQDLSVIDRPALHAKLLSCPGDKLNTLTFMSTLRQRIRLPGDQTAPGARSLAIVGDHAWVGLYFRESLGEFCWNNPDAPQPFEVALCPTHPLTSERRGESFFHDAEICLQQWQSCASCHPDARSDGLNWDLLNDGIGNPKQSKSMLLSHQTPPTMATGIRPNAEVAVRAGVKYIQFGARPESEYIDIDHYLKGLKPETSPYLVDGRLSPAAQRGRQLFNDRGCIACHPLPLYTDLSLHSVGTGTGAEADREYDTPSLIELWRTSPYLHDGRTDNVIDLIQHHNVSGVRGKTTGLNRRQVADLAEFLLSL
jgi:DNA-binding beta-propeller fold protein YncE